MKEFGPANTMVFVMYLLGVVGAGVWLARRQRTREDFFLAGRSMPWLAVGMSMYASVTSAMTYMGLPGLGYGGNLSLLLVSLMSPLVAPVLIFGIYPIYRRLEITTSYEFIERRFGEGARRAAAGLFLLARLGWLGTVIYAPSLALHVATGFPLRGAVVLIGLLATLYCALGGLRAVIWTDVPQFLIMIGGALWIFWLLQGEAEGGIGALLEHAGLTGAGLGLDWGVDLSRMTAMSVVIAYFVMLIYDYGVDQITVQRLMAVKTERGVGRAIAFNALTDFFLIGLLLVIGAGLSLYYLQHPGDLGEGIAGEKVLPWFITHALPGGVSGLLIAALFAAAMSSVDSGIHSMSTVILTDLVRSGVRKGEDSLVQARLLTAGLGLGATGFAWFINERIESIVASFYTFMGLFSAPVLGLFALGMLSRTATFRGWCVGAGGSLLVCWLGGRGGWLHEIYFFPVGTSVTIVVGLIASALLPRGDGGGVSPRAGRGNGRTRRGPEYSA